MPTTTVREGTAGDLAAVLELNQESVPHVSDLTIASLARLCSFAAYFRVVDVDGAVAGFLLGMTPEADYQSVNFRWFKDRYPSFLYIDRVAVSAGRRRLGIGGMLYRDVEAFAVARARPLLTCEINVRPPNPESAAFHLRCGFVEAGTQETEGGAKTVSLQIKQL